MWGALTRSDPLKIGMGAVKDPSRTRCRLVGRASDGGMTDVLFLLLTVSCFGGLAVLAGVLDRFVVDPDASGRDR